MHILYIYIIHTHTHIYVRDILKWLPMPSARCPPGFLLEPSGWWCYSANVSSLKTSNESTVAKGIKGCITKEIIYNA